MTENEGKANAAREAYLRNQQVVAANATKRGRPTPFNVITLVLGTLTVVLYIATVVSYYSSPQQDGPTDVTLPALTSFSFMVTAYSFVLPFLIESRTVGARIRNIVLAAIPTVILAIVGIAIFIDLGSLVADLLYNLGH